MLHQFSETSLVSLRVDYHKVERIGSKKGTIPIHLLDLAENPSFFNVNWKRIDFDWKHVLQEKMNTSFVQVNIFYEHPYFILLPAFGVQNEEIYLNALGYDITTDDVRKKNVDDLSVLEYVLPDYLVQLVQSLPTPKITWHILSEQLLQFAKQNIVATPRIFLYYTSKYCYLCVASVRGILLLNSYFVNDLEDILYYLLSCKNLLNIEDLEIVVLNEASPVFDIQAYLSRFFAKVTYMEFEWLPTKNTFNDLIEL